MESANRIRYRSPDTTGGSERKRRRKVLSCYDCRRRKLQCDRKMPACGRCTKADRASKCLYIEDSVDMPGRRPPPESQTILSGDERDMETDPTRLSSTDLLARLEYQDQRIKQLEAALTGAGQNTDRSSNALQQFKVPKGQALAEPTVLASVAAGPHGAIITDRESTILRGRAFKTQFMGTTCTGGLIGHMPELSSFTREAFEKFPVLAKIRQDVHSLDDKAGFVGPQPGFVSTEQLRALIPGKEEVDRQVQMYFETYGLIYHVLHLPTFYREYDKLWQRSEIANAPFLATLILMLATVQCLTSDQWLKLQCDRKMPACGRCTKADRASKCLYIEDSVDMPGRRPPPESQTILSGDERDMETDPTRLSSTDLLARLEYQDQRIKQLEAALTGAGQNTDRSSNALQQFKVPKGQALAEPTVLASVAAGPHGAIITDRESTILRGRAFKTQFMGTTCTGGLIGHMPELSSFTREAFEKFPVLAKIRQDVHSLDDKAGFVGPQPGFVSTEQLRALIPGKEEVDRQVQMYFETYGLIYHVLHLPTFYREYDKLWQRSEIANAPFLATLILMLATVQCLTSDQWLYAASSSTVREKAITYMTAVETWLPDQSQKHVTAADFQIRFLLLLAKQVAARKFKRTWTEVGTNIRFCMSAGLHRNPELLKHGTSTIDKELRRRIWAAAVEMDLQTSLDRGMIPHNWPLQSDCSAPGNIRDDDLSSESEPRPSSRPDEEFTHTSFLALANGSATLRHLLATMLNNIRQPLSFHDVKRYTEDVSRHIEDIPMWEDPMARIVHASLTLNLRQYLLVIHDRQLRQAETTIEQSFSRLILFDTARDIIKTHKGLVDKGIYALEVLCNDQLRAALSVVRIATTLDPTSDSAISQIIEQETFSMVEDVVEMLTDKINRFGREQRQLWMSLAAQGFLKSKWDPSRRFTFMQEAVDKVTKAYYKIIAGQEDVPTASSLSGPPTIRSARPDDDAAGKLHDRQNATEDPAALPAKNPELDGLDLPLLDMDELAAWTFEDWSFNPDDLFLQQSVYAEGHSL
nr:transcription factor lepe [Quercus suber]